MIIVIKEKFYRSLIVGIVRNKKVGCISYEDALLVKSMPAAKYSCYIITKLPHQGFGISVFSHLPEKVLVTWSLTVIMILFVEAFTGYGHITSIRMDNFPTRSWSEGIEHPSAAHHHGKCIEGVHTMESH